MTEERIFSDHQPRCPLCGVLNQFHGAEESTGRCDNLTPSMAAFLDGFAQILEGNRDVGLTMMEHVMEWTDPADLETGVCPKCGEPEFYVNVPRGLRCLRLRGT